MVGGRLQKSIWCKLPQSGIFRNSIFSNARPQALHSSALNISAEVQQALSERKPVIALESTIITHGLPFPTNVEMAQRVEQTVRSEGVVPATMALLNGQACVGLSSADLELLASHKAPQKVSRRDLAYVMASDMTGGTTVAATMIMAHMAGIRVFATGGLGGVHRGVSDHWDISADLEELGRTPVAVVCSGPKSILDVPKTIEYLETKGCHVSTFSPNNISANVPGFFTADSGVRSPHVFRSSAEAAAVIEKGLTFGLQSGYMFCLPGSPEVAMDKELIENATKAALKQAEEESITGKALTPFLLKKVWEATGGDSVKTNVDIVLANARMAAKIAVSLSEVQNRNPAATAFVKYPTNVRFATKASKDSSSIVTALEEPTSADLLSKVDCSDTDKSNSDFAPVLNSNSDESYGGLAAASAATSAQFISNPGTGSNKIDKRIPTPGAVSATQSIHMPFQLKPQRHSSRVLGKPGKRPPKVVVVGALSQDITCTLNALNISVSSYPGRITTSLGGTAHNVALASAYCGAPTKLISCIGDREESDIAKSVSPALDVSGVKVSSKDRTPRYVCTNDSEGELIVACADMDAIKSLDCKFIRHQIHADELENDKVADLKPICVFDGNLGLDQVSEIVQLKHKYDITTVFEPTSVPKAARLAHQSELEVFPNASIDIATPNYLELMSMFEEFSFKEKFDIHKWFPIIDQLPLSDPISRMKLDIFSRSHPALEKAIVSGLIQASIQLLPYIPNLIVTNGANGVISFQLLENLKDRTGGVKGGPNSVYVLSKTQEFGILIQHFPVEVEVSQEDSKSVNGIGDTFCGALVAQLSDNRFALRDDGPLKFETMRKAMHAASLSLQTYQAVNSDIAELFE